MRAITKQRRNVKDHLSKKQGVRWKEIFLEFFIKF